MKLTVGCGLAVLLVSNVALADTWTVASPTPVNIAAQEAVALTDGSVLLVGGFQVDGTANRAYRFLPNENTWLPAGSSAAGHAAACVAVLSERIYAIGGARALTTTIDGAVAEVDRYEAGKWSVVAPMAAKRRRPGCAPLAGKILVASGAADDGTALASVEIYDPATDAWSAGAPLPKALLRARAAAIPGTNSVLVAGEGGAFVFDGTSWTDLAATIAGTPSIAPLPNGLLITHNGAPNTLMYTSAGLKPGAPMKQARNTHASSVVPDGRVIVSGGIVGATGLASAEVFDPKTSTWSHLPDMPIGRAEHTQTTLSDGRTLLLGGVTSKASFFPPPLILGRLTAAACKDASDCASGFCEDSVCCATVCDGPCQRCDRTKGTCTPIDGAPTHAGCGPYATCAAGACPTSCASNGDCSTGNVCYPPTKTCGPARGLCDDVGHVFDPVSGARTSCGAYNCAIDGACLTQCQTSKECAPGNVCNGTTCQAVAALDEGDEGGCSVRGRGRASGGWALILVMAFLARRIRAGLVAAMTVGCAADRVEVAKQTQAATFSAGAPMTFSLRALPALSALPDGRVLVTGGSRSVAPARVCEIFDPKTGAFTATGRLSVPRSLHAAATLSDGRVIVIGGGTGSPRTNLATTEVWDPTTGELTMGPSLTTPRARAAAVTLKDGRVVMVAAEGATVAVIGAGAEILAADQSAWTALPKPPGAHRAVFALPDDRVLAVGGEGVSASLLDVDGATWTPRPMSRARAAFAATQLADGKVVVVGGTPTEASNVAMASAEVYDPTTDAWKLLEGFTPPSYLATATALSNGKVIILGGADGEIDTPGYKSLARALELDPATGAFRSLGNMLQAREQHAAIGLADGRVLVVGGFMGDQGTNPEVFNAPVGSACAIGGTCATGFCVDGVCCASRCGAACVSCNQPGKVGTCSPVDGPEPDRKDHATCAPYGACIAGACASACAGDAQCDSEHVCDPSKATCVEPLGTCEGVEVVDKATGARRSCSPYRCASRGTCLVRCASSDDCAAGAACSDGRCVAPTAEDAGGCSYGASSSDGLAAAALVLLGILGRRAARL